MSALPPSKSPVFAKAREIAKRASEDYLRNGTDPSEAIVKAAGDELNMGRPFRDLCVSQTNHAIFRDLRQTDKLAEYPVALADKVEAVMGNMQKAASEQVVSSVWDSAPRTAWFEKVATRTRDGVDIDVLGIPTGLKEPRMNTTAITEQKLASDFFLAKQAAELEKQAEYELEMLFVSAKSMLSDFVKTAARNGEDLFASSFNLAANCEPEKKAAAAVFIDRHVKGMIASGAVSKTAAARYEASLKTAALDFLDTGTPISRGNESIVIQLNTLIDAASDKPKEPRFAGPGDYAPAGAYDKIKYKAETISHAPTGAGSAVVRGATGTQSGGRLF